MKLALTELIVVKKMEEILANFNVLSVREYEVQLL